MKKRTTPSDEPRKDEEKEIYEAKLEAECARWISNLEDEERQLLDEQMDTGWAKGYFYDWELKNYLEIFEELYWRTDDELFDHGLDPHVVRNNYLVLTDLSGVPEVRDNYDSEEDDYFLGQTVKKLAKKSRQLLTEKIDRSWMSGFCREDLIYYLEFLSEWYMKTPQELTAQGLDMTTIESNFQTLAEECEILC